MDIRYSEISRLIKELKQDGQLVRKSDDEAKEESFFKQKEMILKDPITGEEKRVRNFNDDGTFNPVDFADEADKFHQRGKYAKVK